jgi:hypothetical protein
MMNSDSFKKPKNALFNPMSKVKIRRIKTIVIEELLFQGDHLKGSTKI